jgi:hypothetical protein
MVPPELTPSFTGVEVGGMVRFELRAMSQSRPSVTVKAPNELVELLHICETAVMFKTLDFPRIPGHVFADLRVLDVARDVLRSSGVPNMVVMVRSYTAFDGVDFQETLRIVAPASSDWICRFVVYIELKNYFYVMNKG